MGLAFKSIEYTAVALKAVQPHEDEPNFKHYFSSVLTLTANVPELCFG